MPTATAPADQETVVLRLRRLRVIREQHGLSQFGLGELSGVPQPVISRAERWGRAHAPELEKMARALGVEDSASLLETIQFEATASIPPPPPAVPTPYHLHRDALGRFLPRGKEERR